jgi:hypothetical protein
MMYLTDKQRKRIKEVGEMLKEDARRERRKDLVWDAKYLIYLATHPRKWFRGRWVNRQRYFGAIREVRR